MRRLSQSEEPPFAFWNYFENIPASHFENHDCSEGMVDSVYEDQSARYQHILVRSDSKNVFMVMVLDLENRDVLGHRLLSLNEEYGIET